MKRTPRDMAKQAGGQSTKTHFTVTFRTHHLARVLTWRQNYQLWWKDTPKEVRTSPLELGTVTRWVARGN